MYHKILMAFNGSREGRTALLECAEIAAFMKASREKYGQIIRAANLKLDTP